VQKNYSESSLMGYEAIDLIKLFPIKFPEISCFYFKTYSPEDGVEKRLDMKELRLLAAAPIRELMKRHPNSDFLVDQLLKHVRSDESKECIGVPREDFASKLLDLEAQCNTDGKALALYSFCRDKSGNELHIPMMDFRIESGNDIGQINLLRLALMTLEEIDGVLLNSGKSYHYYGFRLLKGPDWIWFMRACLLLEPFVDVRYIAHRMLAGKASLRVTAVPEVKPEVPKVVFRLREPWVQTVPSGEIE
jgi:hypothetical protein